MRTGLYTLALAFAIVGLIWLMSRDAAPTSVTHEREAAPLDRTPTNSVVAGLPNPSQEHPTGLEHLSNELTPADVMGNPDCLMKPGAMHARDLAVVVVPGQDGSRFAVVDRSGVVFGDSLPFPTTVEQSFARREDGSVLAGFGGLDVSRTTSRGPATQGVVVYQDGQIIFENPEATGFGVAHDGSSFFVLEPIPGPGSATRLVIRNLDLGVEVHHDLGTLQPDPDTNVYPVWYSLDRSEVIVGILDTASSPERTHFADATFITSHTHLQFSFFPADGGETRKLADYRGFPRFVSSNEVYFALPRGDGYATVKREYAYEGGEVSVEEQWSRDLHPGPVADDGAWLVAVNNSDDWLWGGGTTEAHILDASTGDSRFVHRWSTPVNHSSRIHDGRLALGHRVVERGSYRTVYDVYDIRALVDGDPPNHYQVVSGENPHCGSGEDPFGKLDVRDDQLIYVPRR
ncbi:MAG: hypothetical protein F4X98_19230 [Gammaproteobacteria bacterium]|nr:hypothetical protein [Gammaproteobacteria bacterium]